MNQRQEKILGILERTREASVVNLAVRLGVATMTIRRDLDGLEREGLVARIHGGARLSGSGIVEFAFRERGRRCQAEKRAIAAKAAELVEPGMAVILDTGTTTLEVARRIARVKGLKVLTSSLAIASVLYSHENIDLVLLGGAVRKSSPDLSGPLTESNLRQFRAALAIVGADALSREGAFTTDAGIAQVSKAMIAAADRCVLVADSSKFAATAFVKFADWRDIDCLITDGGVPRATAKWLDKAARRVHYVRTRRSVP